MKTLQRKTGSAWHVNYYRRKFLLLWAGTSHNKMKILLNTFIKQLLGTLHYLFCQMAKLNKHSGMVFTYRTQKTKIFERNKLEKSHAE